MKMSDNLHVNIRHMAYVVVKELRQMLSLQLDKLSRNDWKQNQKAQKVAEVF